MFSTFLNLITPKIVLIYFLNSVLFFSTYSFAQNETDKSDINGVVKDAESGESLPYANIILIGTKYGTMANSDGYFVLVDAPVDTCMLEIRYIGFKTKVVTVVNIPEGLSSLTIEMEQELYEIEGVTVKGQTEMLDASRQVSRVTISPREIATLPNIGEVDVFRALQLLPGISGASDGESGLYVRGGTPDQNLVLFDGMTMYHVDHFFGFFSAFNADAIKDIQVYKGGFPAEYGGRTSSVVNLTGKSGSMSKQEYGFGGNLLSVHGNYETPLPNNLGSFLVAGRRSYTDFIQSDLYNSIYELTTGEESANRRGGMRGGGSRGGGGPLATEFNPGFYFHDFNSKITLNPTEKDIIAFSVYHGRDFLDKSRDNSGLRLRFSDTGNEATVETTDLTRWGNIGYSGKHTRYWNERIQTNLLAAYSKYFSEFDRNSNINEIFSSLDDSLGVRRGMAAASEEDNTIKDVTVKLDTDWHISRSHTLKLGVGASLFDAAYTSSLNDTTQILNRNNDTLQHYLYTQDTWNIYDWELTFGYRSTLYQETNEVYHEPRASVIYNLTDKIKLKGAWGHYYQFVNRITNENVLEGGRDFWILADDKLKPGFAEHQIFGASYENWGLYFSAEAYQKDLKNLVEYTRRFSGRADYQDYFYIGEGTARGIEFLAQKKKGAFTGWLGYTLAKINNHFPAFNDGEEFPADHDRRHEINVVGKYKWGLWTFASTWVYASGKAYTAPESQYSLTLLDGESISYIHVSDKNANRLPDYHRLDISGSRRFEYEAWIIDAGISIFNAYNHKNVWYREYGLDTVPVTVTDALMLGFTPTIYMHFKHK
jgi:ferric enterobactin receptor